MDLKAELTPKQWEAHKRVVDMAIRETRERMNLLYEMRAGPLRFEAIEFEGKMTFTLCYNNDVMAHMGEDSATLFNRCVNDAHAIRNDRNKAIDEETQREQESTSARNEEAASG